MPLRDRKLWFREYRKTEYDKRKRREYYERNREKICAIVVSNVRKRKERKAGRPAAASCEICGNSKEQICFDHCHQTGKFRGWLCRGCNSALGHAKDDPNLLRKLADYLDQHK